MDCGGKTGRPRWAVAETIGLTAETRRAIARIVEHSTMLPVERDPAGVVSNGDLGVPHSTLYVACFQAMRGFLDDLNRSERKHHPETLNDFRDALGRVAAHTSERYFILKQIIIGNLYVVDIMEEAVEICKLRLFLKLVSQLESYEQIETPSGYR